MINTRDTLLVTLVLFSASCVSARLEFVLKDDPEYSCMSCKPEQIHIGFGEKTNDIVVTWSTFNATGESRVQFGVGGMEHEAAGSATKFVYGTGGRRHQYVHRVTLRDLQYDTRYVYHAGSKFGWSEKFSFKTPPKGEDWVVRAAIYGDMGLVDARSFPYLKKEVEKHQFDIILHVGDLAYDMNDEEGAKGDQFMRMVQPLAAIVPYMVCPGNHEKYGNFTHYRHRFSMPGGTESLWYSFDLGSVHFVSIDTEVYYYLEYGIKLVANQFKWLREDLEEANKPENRAKRPWIILFGHRPMYCSDIKRREDCVVPQLHRIGLNGTWALEPLLKEFGVDLVIWAHEHSYERTWPMYDERVYNGSLAEPYHNPRAPVHIITGTAGNWEHTDPFKSAPPAWSAYRSPGYGYTRFWGHNHTHLHFQQVNVTDSESAHSSLVIDDFWIVKDEHAPYHHLPDIGEL